MVYQGTVNSSVVRTAAVFRLCLAHNHLSGDPTPSPQDARTTKQLRKAGECLDIELPNHLVIGPGGGVSA
jgi:DNA repair protein RadC